MQQGWWTRSFWPLPCATGPKTHGGPHRTGWCFFARNARPMLVNAAWLTLVVWVLSFVVFLIMLAPAVAAAWALTGEGSAAMVVFAVVFAWAVKAALIEPFAVACMLQVFFMVTEGQTPQPDWSGRLAKTSQRVRQIGERALNMSAGTAEVPGTYLWH